MTGYEVGDRVLVGAITPCGQCRACLSGQLSQCGHGDGYEAIGGWRFGNTINGAQAEYLLVPYAQANLAKIPDDLTDEQVVLLADIASTGFGGAESGGVRIGDAVVVFAQGPIGLCATAGAKLMGASLWSSASTATRSGWRWPGGWAPTSCSTSPRSTSSPRSSGSPAAAPTWRSRRSARSRRSRARCAACDPAARCRASASTPASWRCRTTRSPPASATTGSSPRSAPAARSACGRLMAMVQSGRFDPTPLLTHRFALDDIGEAYELFGDRRDGVLKVAITP